MSKKLDLSYEAVMGRKGEIMKSAIGMDYSAFESGGIAFDYEAMMKNTGYTLQDIIKIQLEVSLTKIFMTLLLNSS